MQKQKIAIISVLKPVDDIRSYRKIAQSISEIDFVEIHLFGQRSKSQSESSEPFHFHPHNAHHYGPISRLLIGIRIFFKLFKVRPKVIMSNTHELLIVTVLCKILFGSKILYDIQENYYFNLLYQNNYSWLLRFPLAVFIRAKETLLSKFFDHFVLAERTYSQELSFLKNRFSILENKAIIPNGWEKFDNPESGKTFLFSGTLTESNGIKKAITWFQKIMVTLPDVKLIIAGHCPGQEMYNFLKSLENESIELDISRRPIPYVQIQNHIRASDVGIVSYQTNKSNQHCMPTKVFEYLASGLPLIFEKGAHWEKLINEKNGGIAMNQDMSNHDHVVDWVTGSKKKNSLSEDEDLVWIVERKKIIEIITPLI